MANGNPELKAHFQDEIQLTDKHASRPSINGNPQKRTLRLGPRLFSAHFLMAHWQKKGGHKLCQKYET